MSFLCDVFNADVLSVQFEKGDRFRNKKFPIHIFICNVSAFNCLVYNLEVISNMENEAAPRVNLQYMGSRVTNGKQGFQVCVAGVIKGFPE